MECQTKPLQPYKRGRPEPQHLSLLGPCTCTRRSHDAGQNAIGPLVGVEVIFPVQLAQGNGLRVQGKLLGPTDSRKSTARSRVWERGRRKGGGEGRGDSKRRSEASKAAFPP